MLWDQIKAPARYLGEALRQRNALGEKVATRLEFGFIDKATHNSFFLDMMRERAAFLERIVSAAHGEGSFDAIRDDLNKKLSGLAESRKRTLGIQSEHLTPDGERAAHYQDLLRMLDHFNHDRESNANQ